MIGAWIVVGVCGVMLVLTVLAGWYNATHGGEEE
jgi:uncharacterized membrane protein